MFRILPSVASDVATVTVQDQRVVPLASISSTEAEGADEQQWFLKMEVAVDAISARIVSRYSEN